MTHSFLPVIQQLFDWANSPGLTGWLGIYGALLATGHACISFRERRLQLSTTSSFSDPDHGGNQIIIQNSSKTPVNISHWELMWRKKRLFKTETTKTLDCGYPEDLRTLNIGAYGTCKLTFTDQDYFAWGGSTAEKGKLYLELHIAKRTKPVMLKVYDPVA